MWESEYKPHKQSAYGVSGKLADYYWIIGILCGIAEYAILAFIKIMPWYGYILLIIPTIFCIWVAPIVIILLVYLLEQLTWCIFHPKKVHKGFLKMVAFVLILFLSGWLSLQIPRVAATCFANTDYSFWECCYISESPNATKFHYTDKCKNLKRTTYDIEQCDLGYAEEMDYEPCQTCLKQSLKYQFDEFAPVLFIPISVFMFWLISKTIDIFLQYKLRTPIVKR